MEPANHEADIRLEGTVAGLTVGDLMTHHVHTVTPDDRLDDMHALMRMTGTRHLPVMAGDKLVGVVSDRDVMLAWAQGPDTRAAAIMTRQARCVAPDTPARDAAFHMLHDKIGCLPVLDSASKLVGIVTESDFLAVAYRALTKLATAANGE
jgi:CBS domain-containing protein